MFQILISDEGFVLFKMEYKNKKKADERDRFGKKWWNNKININVAHRRKRWINVSNISEFEEIDDTNNNKVSTSQILYEFRIFKQI